ncbi:hypothetical protein PRZ48_008529 [Zasmidium cellare]|uniref:Amine oxidase domain-containing protein n=1 Tax=Zasmidium cellare TaxID=395010 RepID=A0ABR0EGS2_ZASCE|nr:hypothetical protein PRZ48_008529 [Zasmidium cellare]
MELRSLVTALFALLFWTPQLAASRAGPEVLHRDVCIIGGGAAGTHAAIRLQQKSKSVTLIEKEALLGGHINTFLDPRTKAAFEYGVAVFNNVSLVRDYFDYLQVPLKSFTGWVPNATAVYADLARGNDLPGPTSNMSDFLPALNSYKAQLEKYPYLATGFHLEYPIPEDLLLPFGDFCKKYDTRAVAQYLFPSNGGYGNLLATPTLYLMKQSSMDQVQGILTNDAVNNAARGRNQALHEVARTRLEKNRNDVFVSSRITRVDRTGESGVVVHINTPRGKKAIRASKLVIAIPPTLSTLTPFMDLTNDEYVHFRQFNNSYLWAAVVKNSGIPTTASLMNLDPAAPLQIPAMPQIYGTTPTPIKDLHVVWYRSPHLVPDWEVKSHIEEDFNRLYGRGAEVVVLKNHSPYLLEVALDSVQAGFYDGLNRLQEKWDTFWTGAAWKTNDSTAIWKFNEEVLLPMILASLKGRG